MSRLLHPSVGYFFLPLLVFVVTSLPLINRITPLLALVALAAVLSLRFIPHYPSWLRTLLWAIVVLTLIGSTGWFFSPFFFALYLLAIGLGFIYSPAVAISFTIALMVMFTFSIGEVNPTYDFLTLVSLLTVIPITIALRRSYLIVKEQEKGILILEDDKKQSGITSLECVLNNRVNRIGTQLRQPLTYLKQGLALVDKKKITEDEFHEVLKGMRKAVEELFTLEKEFERGATKNVLLTRHKGKS